MIIKSYPSLIAEGNALDFADQKKLTKVKMAIRIKAIIIIVKNIANHFKTANLLVGKL
ncbi:hypothetical protein P344_03250 [Spiroplasma mirum ATCC 29335]|uniref:Uncharacterized protein n=1 Tax=Spiroplasma mirum ATCC 29335 TaxID=838561 RepID=W6AW90_9MOLU|nr:MULTISPECIES: hypothetical protein [Spiroplasma]AHI57994.1 hypothetical protein P344_03250 [Spiroplasma mirum ATCC 29335]